LRFHGLCAGEVGGRRRAAFVETRHDGGFGQGKLVRGGGSAYAADEEADRLQEIRYGGV
jgi:hypothetical protein